MFTGIIEETGILRDIKKKEDYLRLKIQAERVLEETKIGDSIALNGVCLTVTDLEENAFFADVMPATFNRTNLSRLNRGEKLNLERALSLKSRLGGHIVQGHVDEVGIVKKVERKGNAWEIHIGCSWEFLTNTVERGSVAVDGISLTVAELGENYFMVGIIPHTLASTTLNGVRSGQRVNLEGDILARYVQRFLERTENKDLQLEDLIEQDF